MIKKIGNENKLQIDYKKMQLQINATTRPPANNRALRRDGQIPATVYGKEDLMSDYNIKSIFIVI